MVKVELPGGVTGLGTKLVVVPAGLPVALSVTFDVKNVVTATLYTAFAGAQTFCEAGVMLSPTGRLAASWKTSCVPPDPTPRLSVHPPPTRLPSPCQKS